MTPPGLQRGHLAVFPPLGSPVDRERSPKSGKAPQALRGCKGSSGKVWDSEPPNVTSLDIPGEWQPKGQRLHQGTGGTNSPRCARTPQNTRLATGRPEHGQQEKSQVPQSHQTSERNSRGLQSSGRTNRGSPGP